ncbi:hypothetical protein [Flavobacterium sp.]|uniref:hypothetical protein n=1 Tax=Flavobacterium sp. TaxID=239 RepID=UPI00286C529E|nr:hypothetical protein [Flavobacterium sp.]
MPLTARLRDEENERINNILKRLMGMDYVPENGNALIDEILSGIGLDLQALLEFKPENMVEHLQKHHFDWENAEQFADFLIMLSSRLPENGFSLSEKAIAVYEFVQTESKTFSYTIFNKINAAKK